MCGINGIAHSGQSGRNVDEHVLLRMRDVLRHRGPDDAGHVIDGPIGLGHRRLSIVDLATGHQPMATPDGALTIVFNGEIYNHREQRAALEADGYAYRTRSDTETILHLYQRYGPECVSHLRGMFALAVWDRGRRELFIARDRLGIKPLYYVHTQDGSLYFASEIKALLTVGAVKAQLNVQALPDFLANRATSDDQTLFCGIRRLPPGHTLRWQDGKITLSEYWDLSPTAIARPWPRSSKAYVEQWKEAFHASVKSHLMSDVPLGVFLSGGIDSSAIVAAMSRVVSAPVKTFSVAFRVAEANELKYARMVSTAFGTDHHEVLVEPSEYLAALPHLVWHEDEPIAQFASVPLYFVAQLAARHVKVVLTGEGADELLGGYHRYRSTMLNTALGSAYHRLSTERVRGLVRRLAVFMTPHSMERKLPRTFLWRAPDVESIYFDNFAVFGSGMQHRLLSNRVKLQLNDSLPYSGMQGFFDAYPDATLLQKLLYTDMKTYLHELLMKQDQMSMAASIESRVPFLDSDLVELSMSLPDELKLRGWTTKWVLREAMKGVLPPAIISRPKWGFPVPLDIWFRREFRPLIDEYVLGERAGARQLFSSEELHRLVREHASGNANHAERLWLLVNLEVWQRIFIDQERCVGTLPQLRETTGERDG